MRRYLALGLLLLAGCEPARQEAAETLQPAVVEAREETAQAVVPAVVAIREVVQEAVPEPPVPEPAFDAADVLASALIVRWEVTSPAYYSRRLQGVICPGGASGATFGLGWDGGHNTVQDNARAWAEHAEVDRLAATSGHVGVARCRAVRAGLLDVVVPYPMAESVFIAYALPKYKAIALRKYGQALLNNPPEVRASLYAETYNRGGAIRGDEPGERGYEQAQIRDVCLPARDAECTATQLENMCRLWAGMDIGPGLCNRRRSEARVARGGEV